MKYTKTGNSVLGSKIKNLAEIILDSRRIVVFTGAGISTESGIPDFRGPKGIWTKYDPDDFTIQKFLGSEELRKKQWRFFIEKDMFSNAQPNRAHRAIAELENLGKLDCVVTQNIDGLHHKAGNSPDKIFELHGSVERFVCLDCGEKYSTKYMREESKKGIKIYNCKKCSGILKPDVVFFGEALPAEVLENATKHAERCDLLIVIGSSLVVYPAASIPFHAKRAGAKLVIINYDATPYDELASMLFRKKAGDVMHETLEEVKRFL